jgi:lysophospholipase L1-like esterase
MAGTNDLFQGHSDTQIQADWKDLLKKAKASGDIKFVITSLPITGDASQDQRIAKINEFIKQEAQSNQFDFIDLNQVLLSKNENQRSDYFTDGVHLSELTYGIWSDEINNTIIN